MKAEIIAFDEVAPPRALGGARDDARDDTLLVALDARRLQASIGAATCAWDHGITPRRARRPPSTKVLRRPLGGHAQRFGASRAASQSRHRIQIDMPRPPPIRLPHHHRHHHTTPPPRRRLLQAPIHRPLQPHRYGLPHQAWHNLTVNEARRQHVMAAMGFVPGLLFDDPRALRLEFGVRTAT